jgi:hypothetical protein
VSVAADDSDVGDHVHPEFEVVDLDLSVSTTSHRGYRVTMNELLRIALENRHIWPGRAASACTR